MINPDLILRQLFYLLLICLHYMYSHLSLLLVTFLCLAWSESFTICYCRCLPDLSISVGYLGLGLLEQVREIALW